MAMSSAHNQCMPFCDAPTIAPVSFAHENGDLDPSKAHVYFLRVIKIICLCVVLSAIMPPVQFWQQTAEQATQSLTAGRQDLAHLQDAFRKFQKLVEVTDRCSETDQCLALAVEPSLVVLDRSADRCLSEGFLSRK